MRLAQIIAHVEYCGECPFAQYRNNLGYGMVQICEKLSQEDKVPFAYVEVEQTKDVRPDCPLPEVLVAEKVPFRTIDPELPTLTIDELLLKIRLALINAPNELKRLPCVDKEVILSVHNYDVYANWLKRNVGFDPKFDKSGEEIITYRGIQLRTAQVGNEIIYQAKQTIHISA